MNSRLPLLPERRSINRHWREETPPTIFDKPLDLAFIVAFARTAKAICKQIMADQPGKGPCPLARAIAADLYDLFAEIDAPRYRKAVLNAIMAVLDVQLLPEFKDKCEPLMRDRTKYEKHAERSRKLDGLIIRLLYPLVEPQDRFLIESICEKVASHQSGIDNFGQML